MSRPSGSPSPSATAASSASTPWPASPPKAPRRTCSLNRATSAAASAAPCGSTRSLRRGGRSASRASRWRPTRGGALLPGDGCPSVRVRPIGLDPGPPHPIARVLHRESPGMLKERAMSQPRLFAASDDRPAPAMQPPARRGELDLLRALVVVGLVFFHTAVIFGAGEFPVKAEVENPAAMVFIAFGATWGMPLLFVVSGMGIWYSLRSRSAGAFARERVRRLLVPLLTGLVALVPLQVYLGSRRGGDSSSYAAFYARFWDVRPSLNFPFVVGAAPGTGVFEVGHLWFLVCLLAFSLVLLPGFAWLRRPRGMRLVERLAGLLARPGAVFLLATPLVAVELPLGSEVGHAAWNRYSYALLLAYGYLTVADPRIGEAFQRQR